MPTSTQPGTNTDGDGESASTAGKRNNEIPGVSEENGPQKPKISISKFSNVSPSPQNPFSQLGVRPSDEGSQININPANRRSITPMKRDRPSSASEGFSLKTGDSLEVWENKALGGIFRLSLDPNINRDSHGNHLHFVQSVRSDLEEQNEALMLNTAILDQAILEAASKLEKKTTPLEYLLGCWKRVSKQHRALKGASIEDPKYGIIKEARRLCMSYCMFAVTMPDMFE